MLLPEAAAVAGGTAAAGTVAGDAFMPALLAGTGESVSGAALGEGAALAGAGGEDFAAQMAGNTIAGTPGGDASGMVGSQAFGTAAQDPYPPYSRPELPYTLGNQAALFDTAGLTSPLTMGQAPFAPGGVTTAAGKAATFGPAAAGGGAGESAWLAKLKDPKTVMHLGMMAAQLGTPQHGGPQLTSMDTGPYRPALSSQEEITKRWLMQNDPNTYRRIYGNPQGVA
jgi:hypothetical protein